ncbi:hypothetical protein FHY64_13740 [Pelagovum pacificum]|uniref:Uncharacterized protein n=2 Tax=Pelagovum pacificum TaxID=2588711 RepID=A0A5C5GAT3_9RHOB|nr:hypothetical protein I8N54_14560 [Pelagovum pacificum]TNY31673.1 hypothetical protein FHY64_13740 [Pelagovum pacificum]
MAEREAFLVSYATAHAPVTVRGLYYQAEVAALPGIEKTENGYRKVQSQVLKLRQAGRMPYSAISDATRYMRKPRTFDGWEEALSDTVRLYRKSLWADQHETVEVWLEKSALAGVIYPVTAEYDVPLMCTVGFTSETFAYEAVEMQRGTGQRLVILALYDFDRAGQDACRSLQSKVERFAEEMDVEVAFEHLGLNLGQVRDLSLPTRPPKRKSPADRRWPHDIAAELDAIPPDDLRALVREAIERRLPLAELERLKDIEEAERDTLRDFLGSWS